MALLFGTNFMASDIAKILEQNDLRQNGIRTWRQLFGNASLGYNAQSSALRTDYNDVIAQAYKSNLARQNAVASAGLNLGATNELMGLTQQDLHNTYQTYINNYKQSLSALDENYFNEVTSLNDALLERAQNYADYFSAGVDYFYNHLTGSTYDGTDYFTDKGMDWLWENTPDKSLASREQLMNILFDENGTLTKEGTQFFDAVYNATPYGYTRDDGSRTMSFDEWLSGENPDLREWAASIDNFNYNFARTNKGTANILLGRESTDEKYRRGDYVRGNDAVDLNLGELSQDISWEEALAQANRDYERGGMMTETVEAVGGVEKYAKNLLQRRRMNTLDEVDKQYNSMIDTFKSYVTPEMYDEFVNRYGLLLSNYDTMLRNMKTIPHEERYYDLFNSYYEGYEVAWRVVRDAMNNFLKEKSKVKPKKSGY
ncbi:MAG: hypothetical protein IKA96_02260 [Alistipes sp.]|nr:hypothetical protein [Alistipes sp.]